MSADRILLAHGAGGRLTRHLVEDVFLPAFQNPFLATLSDAAVLPELPPGRPALTTDGFVVDPPVFPGGDLGYLSVCGTVNDLAVAGARPLWLTWALILEEGVPEALVKTCVQGASRAAAEAGVTLVAGDTKVVPRGKGDKLFVVTAGLGVVPPGRDLGDHRIAPGDVIIATGPLGDHGATIMACRHALSSGGLCSDVSPLNGLLEGAFAVDGVRSAHDPTRGGVLGICHEVAARANLRVILDESTLPVRAEVRAVCDLLGLHAVAMACEGRALLWVAPQAAGEVLERLREHPLGRGAALAGRVEAARAGRSPVAMTTVSGEERPLDLLSGSELPRIC